MGYRVFFCTTVYWYEVNVQSLGQNRVNPLILMLVLVNLSSGIDYNISRSVKVSVAGVPVPVRKVANLKIAVVIQSYQIECSVSLCPRLSGTFNGVGGMCFTKRQ